MTSQEHPSASSGQRFAALVKRQGEEIERIHQLRLERAATAESHRDQRELMVHIRVGILLGGLTGKNAEERDANLHLQLETLGGYQAAKEIADRAETRMRFQDAYIAQAEELLRLGWRELDWEIARERAEERA